MTVPKQMLPRPCMSCTHGCREAWLSQQQTQLSVKASPHSSCTYALQEKDGHKKGFFCIPVVFLVCWMGLAGAEGSAPTRGRALGRQQLQR